MITGKLAELITQGLRLRQMAATQDQGDAHRCIGNGGQRQGPAQRGTDAQFPGCGSGAKGHGDECYHAFRQRRAKGGEDGAGGLLAESIFWPTHSTSFTKNSQAR